MVAKSQEGRGMMSYHAFLIGWNNPGFESGIRCADPASRLQVARPVHSHAEPGAALHHLRARRRVVLSDTAGEHQTVDAAECSRHRADLPDDAVDEQGDRLSR